MQTWRSLLVLCLTLTVTVVQPTQAQATIIYVSPRPNATFVSPSTTLALRSSARLDPRSVAGAQGSAVGSASGAHALTTSLADDGKTAIYTLAAPFQPGETVQVRLGTGLRTTTGASVGERTYSFTVSGSERRTAATTLEVDAAAASASTGAVAAADAQSRYKTLPADFPTATVTTAAQGTAPGYLFLSNFNFYDLPTTKPYLLILDDAGEPIYAKRLSDGTAAVDFKKQPNGLLSYWDPVGRVFQIMDSTYTLVETYQAGNGYPTDQHDLQILSNGHALLMIYDYQKVDMSEVVAGGDPEAWVIGLVIQELDSAKNVVFEWRSWDHFEITDSVVPLTTPIVDYAHGNAVEQDFDGNLLISSRHMDEITKINRQTGDIIWRWGGKHNEFTFRGDGLPFVHQHDVRRLPGGTISLFDNRTATPDLTSRAIEYRLDEFNKTATPVWQYRNTPTVYSFAMGNAQRLPNGNTVIGWGSSQPNLTEVRPDGTKALELRFDNGDVSYRAFRFPWQAQPATPPTLVATTADCAITLDYSWNGATDVVAYQVFAGTSDTPNTLIATQPRNGFETSTTLTTNPKRYTHFQVLPIDRNDAVTQRSNVAQADIDGCLYPTTLRLPMMSTAR